MIRLTRTLNPVSKFVEENHNLYSQLHDVFSMRISDFDSNGLIFLMNPNASACENDMELYTKAVENVLDAQRFSCIPLVDAPRVRIGTNDLKTRASYEEPGGKITHLARKGMAWEGGGILYFERDEVAHINDEDNVVQAVLEMFHPGRDGRLPLLVTVGGTEDHPVALFSEHELLSDRTKLELYRQFSVYESMHPDPGLASFINGTYRALDPEQFHSLAESKFRQLAKGLADVSRSLINSKADVGLKRVQHRSFAGVEELKFGRLQVGDIMQHACVGVRWDEALKEKNQPKENLLARDLLSTANDFTYLAVFNKNNELQPAIIKKKWQQSRPKRFIQTSDSIESLFQIPQGDDVFLIEPNPELITAEGPMRWPAIVTKGELCSKISALNYFVLMSAMELALKRVIFELQLHREWEHEEKKDWMKKATLGSVLHVLRNDESKLNQVCKRLNLSNSKEFKQSIKDMKDFRNMLGHGAFDAFFKGKAVIEGIGLKDIKTLYWLKKVLRI